MAAVSSDTPLVTVVGGRLIARGEISPLLLTNEDDFRHQVFDRFYAEYEDLLPAGRNWRELLNLIAAVGPCNPTERAFWEPAAEKLGLQSYELIQATDVLENHGLLLRGGRLVKIVPDVLSDFLLEGACVTESGEITGFADYVFHKFRQGHISNILKNLGELDWRIIQREATHASILLNQIWGEINTSFTASDAAGRLQWLRSLTLVAFFQPERTLTLIRRAIEMPATPTALWQIDQDDVLRELPSS